MKTIVVTVNTKIEKSKSELEEIIYRALDQARPSPTRTVEVNIHGNIVFREVEASEFELIDSIVRTAVFAWLKWENDDSEATPNDCLVFETRIVDKAEVT